jgi:hypothetical protein
MVSSHAVMTARVHNLCPCQSPGQFIMQNLTRLSILADDGSAYYNDSYNVEVQGGGWTKHSGPYQMAVGNIWIAPVGHTLYPSTPARLGSSDSSNSDTVSTLCFRGKGRRPNATACAHLDCLVSLLVLGGYVRVGLRIGHHWT